MLRTPARSIISFLATALLVWPIPGVVGATLSDEAVREAYFLGQRNDEKTARFLETYRRHLPMTESGLYVSEIELFTPYAETVDLSRQRTFGYSAQQAAREYCDRGDVFPCACACFSLIRTRSVLTLKPRPKKMAEGKSLHRVPGLAPAAGKVFRFNFGKRTN